VSKAKRVARRRDDRRRSRRSVDEGSWDVDHALEHLALDAVVRVARGAGIDAVDRDWCGCGITARVKRDRPGDPGVRVGREECVGD